MWTNPTVPGPEVLDRLSLRLGWRTGLPVAGYRDGIATVQQLGDLIVVQNRRGAITAIDPVTGAARWTTTVGLPYPVIQRVGFNDYLILVANGTRIFALDRPTGKNLWNVDLAGTPSSPPSADNDAFYVCLSNGRLSAYAFPGEPSTAPPGALSGATGAKEPGRTGASGRAAAAGSGNVRTGPVPARPSANGNPATSTDTGKGLAGGGGRTGTANTAIDTRSATTAMQVTGGRTATTGSELNRTGRGQVVANAPRLLWDYQTNLRIAERPVLGELHVLVVGSGPEAVFLDKNGRKPVDFLADAPFSAPVAQYGATAYTACTNGTVYALDLLSRAALWQVTVNGAVTERPVATDDDLFVISERGGLTRMARATGEPALAESERHPIRGVEPEVRVCPRRGRAAADSRPCSGHHPDDLGRARIHNEFAQRRDGPPDSGRRRRHAHQPTRSGLSATVAAPEPAAADSAGRRSAGAPEEAKPETPAEAPVPKPAPKPRTPPVAPKPKPEAPSKPPA